VGKTIWTEVLRMKNFLLQMVNLPGGWALNETPGGELTLGKFNHEKLVPLLSWKGFIRLANVSVFPVKHWNLRGHQEIKETGQTRHWS